MALGKIESLQSPEVNGLHVPIELPGFMKATARNGKVFRVTC